MKSTAAHMNLVGRYLSGQATSEEVTRLEALILEDPQLRADFLSCARVDAALPGAVGGKMTVAEFPSESPARRRWVRWAPTAAAAAILVVTVFAGGLRWWKGSQNNTEASPVVARFAELRDCRWMDSTIRVDSGDTVASGERIELSAGSAEMRFNSGARLTITGPTIIEPLSENGAFLILGEVHLAAETPESKGFTLVTPSSKFVDIGTAFTATVSPDGLSRLQVSEGEVDVMLDGTRRTPRLRAGDSLYVEPGKRMVMARIESGDGTAAFRFPTIEPPSREDLADAALGHAGIRVTQGRLRTRTRGSGPPAVLLDGTGQSHQDAPEESAFFELGTGGSFLVDLGRAISVTKVNSYSWHQHETRQEHRHRATQRFTLYGFSGDQLPDMTKSPGRAGWTRIARVNSDRFLEVSEPLERPAQQACSITAARGEIGRFRYLLWVTQGNTFFGEFDVFGSP